MSPVARTLVGLYFGDTEPADYDDARRTDEAAYAAFFHAMLRARRRPGTRRLRGQLPGLAHTDELVDEVIDHAVDAASEVAAQRTHR